MGFIGALIMFLIAYSANTGLTLAKIFSILEIVTTLKLSVLMVALGFGVYYELKVSFGRFASIFNIKNTYMI
jgi:hypothetical protein